MPAPRPPVDPPTTLWSRWAALAVALRAIGIDDVHSVDEDGLHYDDQGGNDAHLVMLEGDRAVLYGYDHEYSGTTDHSPPIDLLDGAPAWVPWDLLEPRQREGRLGFACWCDGGAWRRVDYPATLRDDGLAAVVGDRLGDDATVAALRDVATRWIDHRPAPDEGPGIDAAAAALLDAAHHGRLGEEEIAALLTATPPATDTLAAALTVAADAGLTRPGPAPWRPARTPPAHRTVRRLSEAEHAARVHHAMRTADELPGRDRVAAPRRGLRRLLGGGDRRSPEERALLDHVRDRRRPGRDRAVLLLQVSEHATAGTAGDHPLRDDGFDGQRADKEHARALRDAERDPEAGAWLFVRVDVGPDGERIDRAYDHWPAWWTGPGPWRSHLQEELSRRGPAWRPAWASLLADDVAFDDVPIA
ncbi:MAG: hypothetical protein AB7G37_05505 [Solirubrobacteraceae bacterium]